MFDSLKKSWALPLLLFSIMLLGIVKYSKFSIIDYIADRTADRINVTYWPYGPVSYVNQQQQQQVPSGFNQQLPQQNPWNNR